ncbi:fucose 4-O-acetylase-like acetyltransferase [Streptosporangium becharense]|uniref:Fucose 4-O-acetylase-like acetyltransferase n=1 Tax=Streptosporangium becharense TaxID=1816182 RepID=A0A7W9IEQ0_9ACTN|nr:acyltransferase family protein [Streptosporangium becharense]MBB2909682.1 fucose 4-O-acetylase-like acetyltransferase [Streptosporangium becharense]MBB5819362.1 fucose 4-O-acetylase-like acetyltransferase [Streptosporangium becharense]
MSDIRSFQMPAPDDDGPSGADAGRSTGGQGRTPAGWPVPDPARGAGPAQPAWPEPPERLPAAPGWHSRPDGMREESPGEVTEWGGYPAYREPRAGESYDSQDPLDLSKPLAPDPMPLESAWAQESLRGHDPAQVPGSPWAPESSPGHDLAGGPEPAWGYDPPGATRQSPLPHAAPVSPPPVHQAPPPLPAWAEAPPSRPQPGASPAGDQPSGTHPYAGGPAHGTRPGPGARPPHPRDGAHPQSARPQTAPASPETDSGPPFSYWQSTSGQRSSFWTHAAEPEREAELERQAEREREPQAVEAPAAPAARKKREPYLDNVKFVLIALVVAGHSLVPTLDAHSAKSAYMFIYMFHMPAFVLISGYLGRNFWNSNAKINKLVDTLLIPYVVVEIGYALLRFALGQKWSLTIIDPAWLNWYLLALVLWRISTPVWTRMRQPLLVAVGIYLIAGFSEISGDFSIDRFFGLLPFYVLGLLLKPEHFDLLKPLWVKITSAVVLGGAAVVAVLIAPHVKLDPVYFRYSFKAMELSWWMGLGVRAAVLVAALAMSAAVLALVPRGETWFSDLGTRTLYAYLLHGVVVLIAKDQEWLSFPWLYGPLGVLAIMSMSLLLAIVLCLPETRTLFKWLLEPRLVWLYRRPAGPDGTPATAPAGPAPATASGTAAPAAGGTGGTPGPAATGTGNAPGGFPGSTSAGFPAGPATSAGGPPRGAT